MVPSLDLVVVRIGADASGEGSVAISEFDNRFLANFCKAFGYVAPPQTFSIGLSVSNSNIEVSIPTWNGRLYSLEQCDDLADGTWNEVLNGVEGTGLPLLHTNALAATQEFYRARTWSLLND